MIQSKAGKLGWILAIQEEVVSEVRVDNFKISLNDHPMLPNTNVKCVPCVVVVV